MILKLYVNGEYAFYYESEKAPQKAEVISIDTLKHRGKFMIHNVDSITEIRVINNIYTAKEVTLVYVESASPSEEQESELDKLKKENEELREIALKYKKAVIDIDNYIFMNDDIPDMQRDVIFKSIREVQRLI